MTLPTQIYRGRTSTVQSTGIIRRNMRDQSFVTKNMFESQYGLPLVLISTLLLLSPSAFVFGAQESLTTSPDMTSTPTISWTVYHSWNAGQEFERRGTLTWTEKSDPTLADGSATDDSVSSGKKKDDPAIKAGFQLVNDDNAKLSSKDVEEMLSYGWYHIKIESENPGNENDGFIMATIPACNLRRSNFKDEFDVTIPRSSSTDGTAGKDDRITSFAYSALVSPLAPKSCDEYIDGSRSSIETDESFSFSSKLSVQLDTPAMSIRPILPTQSKPPPGLKFLSKKRSTGQQSNKNPSGGAQAGVDGGDGDDEDYDNDKPEQPTGISGFLQKYWYILLPMLIMNIMTAPAADDGQQDQQQQGGTGGGPPPQSSGGAPVASTSGGQRSGAAGKRRGKR